MNAFFTLENIKQAQAILTFLILNSYQTSAQLQKKQFLLILFKDFRKPRVLELQIS